MRFWDAQFCFLSQMKKHKRLLLFQWKYTKTPMSKFECFGHAVKGQCYRVKIRVNFDDLSTFSYNTTRLAYMRLYQSLKQVVVE